MDPIVWPGKPYPLGATWDGEGVNFALFSERAEKVELCLFDETVEERFTVSPCANKQIRSGTAISPKRVPACAMDTVSTARMNPPKD